MRLVKKLMIGVKRDSKTSSTFFVYVFQLIKSKLIYDNNNLYDNN